MPEPYPRYPFNPWFFWDFEKIVASLRRNRQRSNSEPL
jgi:hypothetical protein